MHTTQTGRIFLYAILVPLLLLCSAPDLLPAGLDGVDLFDYSLYDPAWTHLTVLISLLTAFALLHLITLRAAGGQALARSSQPVWRSIPQRTRQAIQAQAENHSDYVIRFIRRR